MNTSERRIATVRDAGTRFAHEGALIGSARLPGVRLLTAVFVVLCLPTAAGAQDATVAAPVIDTVLVEREKVFPPEVADSSGLFDTMNRIHVVTRESVIRSELLFEAGQPLDTAVLRETERNLRKKGLFREVQIDTVRNGARLAVAVRTRDAWSLKPKIAFGAASDGTVTGTLGINELNLLGRGNQVYLAYEKQVDRDGLNATVKFPRVFGSDIDANANYAGLSDGKNGNWYVGAPLRFIRAPSGIEHNGLSADQNVIRYRDDGTGRDSTVYRRTALLLEVMATRAVATSRYGYLRLGIRGEYRDEEYARATVEPGSFPDSTYGVIGGFAELSRVRIWTVNRFNGFAEEDIDISPKIRLGVNFAPSWLGYENSGVGPSIQAAAGVPIDGGKGYAWAAIDANALFSSAGLDSSRVLLNASVGWKPAPDHATVLQVQGGRLDDTAPGSEFDLGYTNAPRSWGPHAFVGTRAVWGTLEHKWFRFRNVFNLVDVALAGFLDYGGAWYEDQDSRWGGNVGAGIRFGSAVGATATAGRLDFGWRFGDGVDRDDRFVVSFGSGFVFPRRTQPAVQYKAVAPS